MESKKFIATTIGDYLNEQQIPNSVDMREYVDTFSNFLLKENLYNIDDILDKISKFGIDSLTFYEKHVLDNSDNLDIQKKLLYQYKMSLNDVKELLDTFGFAADDVYIQETFYIDGEVMIGDYNEDKFNDIISKVGRNNFIYLNKFNGSFEKETDDVKLKMGGVGKINYSNDVIDKVKVYPISINFLKDRIEFTFYDIENDEIIELSKLEKEFGFSSKNDIDNYIQILERLLKNDKIIQTIKNEISNLIIK